MWLAGGVTQNIIDKTEDIKLDGANNAQNAT